MTTIPSSLSLSEFTNNTGSAMYLRLSIAFFSGEVSFVRNMADTGGAMNIQDGSRVSVCVHVCACDCVRVCVCMHACVCTCMCM